MEFSKYQNDVLQQLLYRYLSRVCAIPMVFPLTADGQEPSGQAGPHDSGSGSRKHHAHIGHCLKTPVPEGALRVERHNPAAISCTGRRAGTAHKTTVQHFSFGGKKQQRNKPRAAHTPAAVSSLAEEQSCITNKTTERQFSFGGKNQRCNKTTRFLFIGTRAYIIRLHHNHRASRQC